MQQAVSIKDYAVPPVVSRISAQENAVRDSVMRTMIATQRPYPLANSPHAPLLRELAARNVMALADDAVVAAYPVSGRQTNKRVIFADGREAYAMCAIDALGFHYAFGEDIRIESVCEACGAPIILDMHGGKINIIEGGTNIHVLHADLQNQNDWSCSCCTLMHFFSCAENLTAWREAHARTQKTFALDLETANKTAWLLFAR